MSKIKVENPIQHALFLPSLKTSKFFTLNLPISRSSELKALTVRTLEKVSSAIVFIEAFSFCIFTYRPC